MSTVPELHHADSRLRRLALWLPVAALVASALVIWMVQRWLGSLRGSPDEIDGLLLAFAGLAGVLVAVSVALGWTLLSQAARIRREDRFPASGMRTIRTVEVRRGPAARRISGWMLAAGIASAAFAVGLFGWVARVLMTIG